jgi:Ankyrin repeats (3 copies)/Ankyrin repeat
VSLPLSKDVLRQTSDAFHADDAPKVATLLNQYAELKAAINEPLGPFDSPAITQVRSRAMLDVLLDAGADINARSKWWAGGFGLLDNASPDLSAYAIERGATLTAHAAARLGMLNELRAMVSADPALVHARGGDGQMPLHFAANVEIAEYLLDRGADIDARDIDHESTAAQYLLSKHPEVTRYLIGRGCATDILAAAALGDKDLVDRLLDAEPECIRMRVSDEFFPMVGGKSGGTIYQWVLGWYVSAVQVAKAFGHAAFSNLLMERCPADEKLLNACWLHDEPLVRSLLAEEPSLANRLTPAGRRQLAHAVRNDDTLAARLMLEAGLPVDTYSQHHATPLHWAAWHGNAELVRLILQHAPPLHDTTNDYQGTPADWAVHGSENCWHKDRGDQAAALDLLLAAGTPVPKEMYGSEAVRAVLKRYGAGSNGN